MPFNRRRTTCTRTVHYGRSPGTVAALPLRSTHLAGTSRRTPALAKQSKARQGPVPDPATESTEFDSFMTAALRTTDVSFVADLAHPTMPRHGAASGRHPAKPKSIAPLTCAHHAAVLFEGPRSGSVMHMRNGCKFPPSCAYRVTATAAQCEHRLHTCWLSIGCESESLPTGTAVPVLQDMLRLRIDTASLPMRPRACSST